MSLLLFLLPSLGVVFCDQPPLTVGVYYDSYSRRSINFLREQLSPAFFRYQGKIKVDLVPYGTTQRTKNSKDIWEFKCEHGPLECWANKLHACAIWAACGEGGTVSCGPDSLRHVIKYINCVTQHMNQQRASQQCAESFSLWKSDIFLCDVTSGYKLVNHYGDRTTEAIGNITSTPWITIDGVFSPGAQFFLQYEICTRRPDICDNGSHE